MSTSINLLACSGTQKPWGICSNFPFSGDFPILVELIFGGLTFFCFFGCWKPPMKAESHQNHKAQEETEEEVREADRGLRCLL